MTYIEIVHIQTEEVVKRIAVEGGERAQERVRNGISMNLNHSEYFVNTKISPVELTVF